LCHQQTAAEFQSFLTDWHTPSVKAQDVAGQLHTTTAQVSHTAEKLQNQLARRCCSSMSGLQLATTVLHRKRSQILPVSPEMKYSGDTGWPSLHTFARTGRNEADLLKPSLRQTAVDSTL